MPEHLQTKSILSTQEFAALHPISRDRQYHMAYFSNTVQNIEYPEQRIWEVGWGEKGG